MKTKRLLIIAACIVLLVALFSINNSAVLKRVMELFDFGGTDTSITQLDTGEYVYQYASGGKKAVVSISEKEGKLLVVLTYPFLSTGLGYEWIFDTKDLEYDYTNMNESDYKEIVRYAEKRLELAHRFFL